MKVERARAAPSECDCDFATDRSTSHTRLQHHASTSCIHITRYRGNLQRTCLVRVNSSSDSRCLAMDLRHSRRRGTVPAKHQSIKAPTFQVE